MSDPFLQNLQNNMCHVSRVTDTPLGYGDYMDNLICVFKDNKNGFIIIWTPAK